MIIVPASAQAIEQALQVLRDGGVVAHATETCYGLACDLQNPDAVAKLFAIKERPLTQPVSALFASVDDAKTYLEWNNIALQLAAEHLPGPLTIVLKAQAGCPLYVTPGGGERIGVRVSPHPTAEALVRLFGSPLSTTSANVHGEPNPYSATDIEVQYADKELKPDLLIDDGSLPQADASTVVDASSGELHVLRDGGLSLH